MTTPQEIMFINMAVQKGYIGQGAAQYALSYQKEFENKGQKIILINYLLAKKILTPVQVEEIKNLCMDISMPSGIKSPQNQEAANIVSGSISAIDTTSLLNQQTSVNNTTSIKSREEMLNTKKLEKKEVLKLSETKKYEMSSLEPQDIENVDESNIKKGEMFGHYRIIEEIGQGGMGFVYKVYDTKLEREVALKVMSLDNQVSEKRKKRFLQEIKATAQLDHPNIVKVLESGDTPQSYFTMEYLEGGTLSSLIKRSPLKPIQATLIIQKITEALHYAHKNGIIHRDIKPSNIMFDRNKEPKLMDFGLSKIVDIEDSLSKSGEALGTPNYMSPEQANGTETEPRSDIYSLGTTLYEMLTGKQVFSGESYYDILNKIFHEEPIPPRALSPEIPKDLEAICLKCLHKQAKNRYNNARSLAKDLKNLVEHKPVSARPVSQWVKFSRFVKKNKAIIFAIVFLCIVIITSLVSSLYVKYNEKKYILQCFYDLQEKNYSLCFQKEFSQKIEKVFGELKNMTFFVSEDSFINAIMENPQMLYLHLLSFSNLKETDAELIKKWFKIYDLALKNNERELANRYFCLANRGFLFFLLKDYANAYQDFGEMFLDMKKNNIKNFHLEGYIIHYQAYTAYLLDKDTSKHFEKIKKLDILKHIKYVNDFGNLEPSYIEKLKKECEK